MRTVQNINVYRSSYIYASILGYRVPDGGNHGWCNIPEFPFGE